MRIAESQENRAVSPSVVAADWPGVATAPRKAWRGALAELLVRRAVRKLPLRMRFGQDDVWGVGSSDTPLVTIADREAFFARLGRSGLIGFGESYMAGEWDAADGETLTTALTILAEHIDHLVPPGVQWLRRFAFQRTPAETSDWRRAARENISAHYDLSNDLFAAFLDVTMTYSAALFTDLAAADWSGLASAQRNKIDRLLDRVGVVRGTRLLEIGTGWGELAIRAAERGAQVTTLTLSEQQAGLAKERVRAAGVEHHVDVRLQDYRDTTGRYDAIVSVEMIEAVGYDQWPTYFMALDRLLAPGGRIGLQAITMPNYRLEQTRGTHGWIHKYIFPGGLIPSIEAIERTTANFTGLTICDRLAFGEHYAATLRIWLERFDENWDQLQVCGFDDTFRRMWRLYLCYARAGFESRYLDVHQLILAGAQ